MDQYSIANGDVKVYNPSTHAIIAFNKTDFLDKVKAEFNAAANPLEVIMQQKWVSSFATMESWFDYRRTGFPNIAGNILNGSQGAKIPSRLMYGENETNYNPKNTSDAISRLAPAANDQWSKMWLLQ